MNTLPSYDIIEIARSFGKEKLVTIEIEPEEE